MQVSSLIPCLWPGLPHLWWRGDWRSLAVAVLFAVTLNFGLLATFVWPEMIPAALRTLGWAGLLGIWGITTWTGLRKVSTWVPAGTNARHQGLFVQAQGEYLKGHWLEAESLLRRILQVEDRDGDARLMLASLLRRAGRVAEAMAELEALELSEAGQKWSLETARERQLLAAVPSSAAQDVAAA